MCCGFEFFFFNDTATTEIYTLSLHDALPILVEVPQLQVAQEVARLVAELAVGLVGLLLLVHRPLARVLDRQGDRKSTRLNSSHANISYAVFCLKKKTHINIPIYLTTQQKKQT